MKRQVTNVSVTKPYVEVTLGNFVSIRTLWRQRESNKKKNTIKAGRNFKTEKNAWIPWVLPRSYYFINCLKFSSFFYKSQKLCLLVTDWPARILSFLCVFCGSFLETDGNFFTDEDFSKKLTPLFNFDAVAMKCRNRIEIFQSRN